MVSLPHPNFVLWGEERVCPYNTEKKMFFFLPRNNFTYLLFLPVALYILDLIEVAEHYGLVVKDSPFKLGIVMWHLTLVYSIYCILEPQLKLNFLLHKNEKIPCLFLRNLEATKGDTNV